LTDSSTAAAQAKLGLAFRDSTLWRRALTHPSYVNEHVERHAVRRTADLEPHDPHNQRLEFLGDAVIDFIVGEWLYQQLPGAPEGDLTRFRISLVRTESLADLALADGLGALLLLGKGEEVHGGRTRITNLCAVFEAICGALYLDQGMDAVRAFVVPRIAARLKEVQRDETDRDAKSRLQELVQAKLGQTPTYHVSDESGPQHQPAFVAEVRVGDKVYGTGTGSSKRQAQQAAAQAALTFFQTSENL
jgi:ribonuclease-3